MVWKPKEKELTRDEAIALAKRELSPFWIASGPLLTAVNGAIIPLDDDFEKLSWLIAIADPTRFDGESISSFLVDLQKRYGGFNYSSLLILRSRYSPLQERGPTEAFSRRIRTTFPVCVDADGKLSAAFGAGELPRLSLLHERKVIFQADGDPFRAEVELKLQKHLRSLDAGLALPIVLQAQASEITDQIVIHCSALPGFMRGQDGYGHFNAASAKGSPVQLHGTWMQDEERIATNDPNASLVIDVAGEKRSGARALSVIARSLSKSGEPARIDIEAGGTVVFDIFGGTDLSFDDEGRSILRVGETRSYQAVQNLPLDRSQIKLLFPSADQVPIAIYGLRVGGQGISDQGVTR